MILQYYWIIFSLKEISDFYSIKFSDGSEYMVLKNLLYFDDAEMKPDTIRLFGLNRD